jgi:hypothetical protein
MSLAVLQLVLVACSGEPAGHRGEAGGAGGSTGNGGAGGDGGQEELLPANCDEGFNWPMPESCSGSPLGKWETVVDCGRMEAPIVSEPPCDDQRNKTVGGYKVEATIEFSEDEMISDGTQAKWKRPTTLALASLATTSNTSARSSWPTRTGIVPGANLSRCARATENGVSR